jgi:DNA-binding Lrp family transcriptional regulator
MLRHPGDAEQPGVAFPHRADPLIEGTPLDTQAHPCFGQPDIFTFVNVADEKSLSDVVITKIHTIEGVEETDTHIVAEA